MSKTAQPAEHPQDTDARNRLGRAFWSRSWSGSNHGATSRPFALIEEMKWDHIRAILPQPCRSLEIGSGTGHLSALLAESGFDPVLLDYVPEALETASQSYSWLQGQERKRYVLGDGLHLPFADGTFGFVGSCGVLEHFEHPVLALSEMVRVLRPGGVFYSDICPGRFSLITMLDFYEKWRHPGNWEEFYENKMTAADIRNLLASLRLQQIHLFSAGVLPPRTVPGIGRIALLRWLERCWLKPKRFWQSLDGTRLSDWLGLYYFVSARKPADAT